MDLSNDSSEDPAISDTSGTTSLYAMAVCKEILTNKCLKQKYSLNEKIGEGSYGAVYKGQKIGQASGRDLAIKVLTYKPRLEKYYKAELEILMDLDHPNIVKFIEGYRHDNCLYIVLEHIEGLTLRDFYHKKLWWEDELNALNIMGAIFSKCFSALQHIHELKFIHRDIKGGNILLDIHGCVKLIDFGLATVTTSKLSTNPGTPLYKAPEVRSKSGKYGTPVDIWSLGVTLVAFSLGNMPKCFATADVVPEMEGLFKLIRRKVSPVVTQIIEDCLKIDPCQRPTASDLLQRDLVNYSCPPAELGELVKKELVSSAISDTSGTTSLYAMAACKEILTNKCLNQKYSLNENIGKGGWGAVYKGQKIGQASGRDLAIKVLTYKPRLEKYYKAELEILMDLDHPNIVKFIEGYRHENCLYIVLELIEGVTLYKFYQQKLWWEDELNALNIMGAIFSKCFSALQHIHELKFIHRDIKGANILLDIHGRVKLIDFGIATVTASKLPNARNPLVYQAPEVKSKSGKYGTPIDIWALGVTLVAFSLGFMPKGFDTDDEVPKMEGLFKHIRRKMSPVVTQIIEDCLKIDPCERPTASDLLQRDLVNYSCPPAELGELVKKELLS